MRLDSWISMRSKPQTQREMIMTSTGGVKRWSRGAALESPTQKGCTDRETGANRCQQNDVPFS